MNEDINKRLLNFEKELKEFHNKDYMKVEEEKVEEKVLGIKEFKEKLDKRNKKNNINNKSDISNLLDAYTKAQIIIFVLVIVTLSIGLN